MRASRASTISLLLLLAAGCARSPAPDTGAAPMSSSDSAGVRAPRAIPVQVNNQSINDMDVYLLKGGGRWLVGHIGGMTKATLSVPDNLAPSDLRVQLRAEPIGGGRAATTPLLIVAPGQQVYWTIGADPATSTASAG